MQVYASELVNSISVYLHNSQNGLCCSYYRETKVGIGGDKTNLSENNQCTSISHRAVYLPLNTICRSPDHCQYQIEKMTLGYRLMQKVHTHTRMHKCAHTHADLRSTYRNLNCNRPVCRGEHPDKTKKRFTANPTNIPFKKNSQEKEVTLLFFSLENTYDGVGNDALVK